MANLKDVRRNKISITLNDGIERELKFDLNAMAELEDAYGSVDKAFEALERNNSVKALRKVIWAGLLHEEKPLDEKQVGKLVDIQYMQELVDSLNDAMTADLPDKDDVMSIPQTTGTDPNAVTA